MQKTFTIYPIDEEPVDDYDNIEGDYNDQFYLPFMSECVDFIDVMLAKNKVRIEISITDEKGNCAYRNMFTPSVRDYLGDDDGVFGQALWNSRDLGALVVSVNICLGAMLEN
jgi:hypothetical protein